MAGKPEIGSRRRREGVAIKTAGAKAAWYVRLFRWVKGHLICPHFSMGNVYCFDCLLCNRKVYKVCHWNYSVGGRRRQNEILV